MGVLPLVAGLFILVAGVEQIEILNSVTQMLHNVAAHSPREASFGAGIIVALFKPDEQPSDWLGRCHRQSKSRCPPSSDKRNINRQLREFCSMMSGMTGTPDDDLNSIEQRNRLRQEAGLPLLNVQAEGQRQKAARDQADFENYFRQRRPEFCHQWIGNGDGWLTNMGRWSLARQRVRQEMQDRHD